LHFDAELINRFVSAARVAVLTGAGISAESGVPTFRGEDGIWKQYRAEELATPEAFSSHPQRVWQWYQYRRRLLSGVQPNPGHHVLAEMEKAYPDFCISTQNVDGLHQKAGCTRVRELHGNITRNRCSVCGTLSEAGNNGNEDSPPRCSCGGLMRPDVVWFGESLPQKVLQAAQGDAQSAELYLTIGTSALVYPAALLPVEAARHGAYVVEVNRELTPLSHQVDSVLTGKSGEILPQLWMQVKSQKG